MEDLRQGVHYLIYINIIIAGSSGTSQSLPALQRAAVHVGSPSAAESSGTSQSLPALQGAVVRVSSLSAAGSSGTC